MGMGSRRSRRGCQMRVLHIVSGCILSTCILNGSSWWSERWDHLYLKAVALVVVAGKTILHYSSLWSSLYGRM